VDEHVSLIALKLGVGIGFSEVVVSVMILWNKTKDWMMPIVLRSVQIH